MNKKQLYLLVIIWSVIVIGVSVLLFKEESSITEKGIEVKEVEQVDVIDDGRKTSILSFEKLVNDVVWTGENRIEFTGQKTDDSEKQRYSFDLEEQVMTRVDQPLSIELDSTKKLITKVNSELGIFTESENSKGIFVLNNGELKTITEDATFEDELKMVVSENKEKIGYYDAKAQKIKTYNIISGKSSNINVFPDAIILNNLEESILFSPDGGYLVVYYYSSEIINETYFSVYGADSGREYSDKIFGLNPSWSPKELKIAYLYGEGAKRIESDTLNGNHHGKRVGYYDLKSRKSLYVGAIMNKRDIVGQIKWARNGEGLGYHTGIFNEVTSGWEIDGFTVYNFEDKSFSVESEPFENGFELKSLGSWAFDSKYYTTSEQSEDQVNLTMLNLELDAYGKIDDIELMTIDGETMVSEIVDDKILYKQDKYLYLTDLSNYEAIITREGDLLDIVISPDRKKICVISSVKNKTVIDIVKSNGNVTVQ